MKQLIPESGNLLKQELGSNFRTYSTAALGTINN